jgi:hypothetical protein
VGEERKLEAERLEQADLPGRVGEMVVFGDPYSTASLPAFNLRVQ